MRVISLREEPVYTQAAINFFQGRWATERSKMIYEDCIVHGLTTESPLPRWYLLLENDKIIGGAGMITNDFVSRMDLWPWVCSVYIEVLLESNSTPSFPATLFSTFSNRVAVFPFLTNPVFPMKITTWKTSLFHSTF